MMADVESILLALLLVVMVAVAEFIGGRDNE